MVGMATRTRYARTGPACAMCTDTESVWRSCEIYCPQTRGKRIPDTHNPDPDMGSMVQ